MGKIRIKEGRGRWLIIYIVCMVLSSIIFLAQPDLHKIEDIVLRVMVLTACCALYTVLPFSMLIALYVIDRDKTNKKS